MILNKENLIQLIALAFLSFYSVSGELRFQLFLFVAYFAFFCCGSIFTLDISDNYTCIDFCTMQENLIQGRPKSDIAFYRAFKQVAGKRRLFAIFKALLLAAMATLIILSYLSMGTRDTDVIIAFIVNAAVSLFGLFVTILQLCVIFSSPKEFLKMAEVCVHVVAQELTTTVKTIEDCVSSKIFAADSNLAESEVNELTKKSYITALSNALDFMISLSYGGFAKLKRFHSILALGSLVYSIVILALKLDLDTLSKAFLISYVVLVGLSEIGMILIIILIVLSPLICCICCCCICCCSSVKGKEINVPVKKAAMEDILNCDGTCSICYQNVGLNEQIYVLPCSPKHIFHKTCLGHWNRIKNTCPNCRAEIPMQEAFQPLPNDQ